MDSDCFIDALDYMVLYRLETDHYTALDSTVLSSTAQHSTALCSVHHCAVYSTVQCASLHNTALCCVQHLKALYSTAPRSV